MENVIHEAARFKAFAKIKMMILRVKAAKEDVEKKNDSSLSIEHLHILCEGYKKELKIWNYIAELIEKTDK